VWAKRISFPHLGPNPEEGLELQLRATHHEIYRPSIHKPLTDSAPLAYYPAYGKNEKADLGAADLKRVARMLEELTNG
jgi:hypothetical protein